jgi:hypothetical protein
MLSDQSHSRSHGRCTCVPSVLSASVWSATWPRAAASATSRTEAARAWSTASTTGAGAGGGARANASSASSTRACHYG